MRRGEEVAAAYLSLYQHPLVSLTDAAVGVRPGLSTRRIGALDIEPNLWHGGDKFTITTQLEAQLWLVFAPLPE